MVLMVEQASFLKETTLKRENEFPDRPSELITSTKRKKKSKMNHFKVITVSPSLVTYIFRKMWKTSFSPQNLSDKNLSVDTAIFNEDGT